MKYSILFSLASLFFFVAMANSNAQCIVDAGENFIHCYPDTVSLNAIVKKGVPPYKIKWETEYSYSVDHTASDFLDDTTSLEAMYHARLYTDAKVLLRLTIEDANHDICRDTIVIRESIITHQTLDQALSYIKKGDSRIISYHGQGGIPPMNYDWTPKHNTDNANSEYLKVWPDTNTLYICEITDSAGCVHYSGWEIEIDQPVSININTNDPPQINIYPNPLTSSSILSISNFSSLNDVRIEVYNVLGTIIFSDEIKSSEYNIGSLIHHSGMYYYSLFDNEVLIATGKLLKE